MLKDPAAEALWGMVLNPEWATQQRLRDCRTVAQTYGAQATRTITRITTLVFDEYARPVGDEVVAVTFRDLPPHVTADLPAEWELARDDVAAFMSGITTSTELGIDDPFLGPQMMNLAAEHRGLELFVLCWWAQSVVNLIYESDPDEQRFDARMKAIEARIAS